MAPKAPEASRIAVTSPSKRRAPTTPTTKKDVTVKTTKREEAEMKERQQLAEERHQKIIKDRQEAQEEVRDFLLLLYAHYSNFNNNFFYLSIA